MSSIDRAADTDKALKVVVNAKMRRTGVCGASETLLVHRDAAAMLLKPLIAALIEAGCAGARRRRRAAPPIRGRRRRARRTGETEYLDADHRGGASSTVSRRRSDRIEDPARTTPTASSPRKEAAAERFLEEVNSAIVLHNASTQFADGGELSFGCRDRHRHRPHARARADRPRAALHLQVPGARRRQIVTPRRGGRSIPCLRGKHSEFEILPPAAMIAAIIIGVMSAAWGEFPMAPSREWIPPSRGIDLAEMRETGNSSRAGEGDDSLRLSALRERRCAGRAVLPGLFKKARSAPCGTLRL